MPYCGGRWAGPFHIVDNDSRKSLESWPTRHQAEHFCQAVNDHESNYSRPRSYVVEVHSPAWRKGDPE